jgi:asparagine synthase (glutamine-hydrolysing)
MVESLVHEQCHETGKWHDEGLGLYVGWVKRRDSSSDCAIVKILGGKFILFFSGEDFSGSSVTPGEAKFAESYEERPDGLRCSAEYDEMFLRSLNGRFHGVLIDRGRSTATVFNDRFGLHRLYFHESRDGSYFACEAKAILAVKPKLRCLDHSALGEWISCGCVMGNRTLFRQILALPPASAWNIQNGTVCGKREYFRAAEWETQEAATAASVRAEISSVFAQRLRRYFSGRVGMSLTGGLDTRMIMAQLNAAPGSLPCYSFGGMFRDCHDVKIARALAGACGQTHEVIQVGQEFLSRFAYYAERAVFLTDGCVSVDHAPDLYVNRLAAEIAPIRMTGNYGGEVLRGVRAFKPVRLDRDPFVKDLSPFLKAATGTYFRALDAHPITFAVFRQAPWHQFGLLALEQGQLILRSPFLDNELLRAVYRAPLSSLRGNALSLRIIQDGNPRLLEIPTDRGLGGTAGWLQSAWARKCLDISAKAEYAYDYGMPHWAAKLDHWLRPFELQNLFLGRHKFYHFRLWYRDILKDYVRETLLDSWALARDYVDRDALVGIVEGHVGGTQNNTTSIHKLLTLELIHRHFIDSRNAPSMGTSS